MQLNYHHLYYFYVTAREGSITKAAQILHLTPQTVSGQLGIFEDYTCRNRIATLNVRVIKALNMQPHPEGGHYAETFRDNIESNGRSVGTAIYYLLKAGERSYWHRVDATEIWHYYAGEPLELSIANDSGDKATTITLGPDIINGQRPQGIVPAHRFNIGLLAF